MSILNRTCALDGCRVRGHFIRDSGYCYAHDPATAQERASRLRRRTRRKDRPPRSRRFVLRELDFQLPTTQNEVEDAMRVILAHVVTGRLGEREGRAAGDLLRGLHRQIGARENLEAQVRELRRALAAKK